MLPGGDHTQVLPVYPDFNSFLPGYANELLAADTPVVVAAVQTAGDKWSVDDDYHILSAIIILAAPWPPWPPCQLIGTKC